MDIQNLFYDSFRELIIENEIKISDISAVTKIAPSLLSRYCRGKVFPSFKNLLSISDFFCCSLDYLFQLTNNKTFNKTGNFNFDYRRIETLVLKSNKSKNSISKVCGFSNSCFYAWRNGEALPDLVNIYSLAKYFGVSMEYLIGRTDS